MFSSQSDIDAIEPVPFYLEPLGFPGTILSFLGSVGKVVIALVHSCSDYLPVWAVVGIAIAIFFLIMYVIVSSAVAYSADDDTYDVKKVDQKVGKRVAKSEATNEDEGGVVRKRRGRSSSTKSRHDTMISALKEDEKETPSSSSKETPSRKGRGAKASTSRSSSRTTRSSRN